MRTFAMSIFSAGNAALLGAVLFFFVTIAPALANEPEAAILIPVFVAFALLFGSIAIVAAIWTGARRRAWFWLAAAVPALAFAALNLRFILYDITRPASTISFLLTILVVAGAVAVVAGGVAAFLDVRRGSPTWAQSGRSGWVAAGLVGAVIGAAVTSVFAGAASTGGAGVADVPTTTGTLVTVNSAFAETNLTLQSGEVLGLFVSNKDDFGHSFDIDALGIHVALPANSTTAVAIQPAGPGDLEFYCSIPGHKAAGMVGTISVD